MRIAILTSGILPVPAVKGGAVENLIDFYLEYNEQKGLHDITVYSVADEAIQQRHEQHNHYHYIEMSSPMAKIRKWLYHLHNRKEEAYHYSIEYYLHEAIRHLRKQHYDIVILENRPGYALKLKGATDARLVYHLHNENLTIQTPRCQEIYDAATRIITVSDYIKSCVKTINGHDEKTTTVHNGIDLHAFSSRRPRANRSSIGLQDDDFVIVFSGRVNEEKGIMQLIEAMLRLKELPQIKLLVLGSSFYGNATAENDFVKRLKGSAESLKERIIFTGFIPYEQMPAYLQMADIAVLPSMWNEPFGLTMTEAQAMGLPIITTRRGGIPEEVTEENAIMLETDEHFVDNLAAAILDLYRHPEKRKAMGLAGLERSRYFRKERYAEDFFKAIAILS